MSGSVATYALLALPVLYVLVTLFVPPQRNLRHIPTVGGPSNPFLAWIGALRYVSHSAEILREGYAKWSSFRALRRDARRTAHHLGSVYKGGVFKHAEPGGWCVVVTGSRKIEELHRAADDELSFIAATNETLQVPYTLGPNVASNLYHVPIVRSQLTRALPVQFPELRDEIVCAFGDAVGMPEEWKAVPAMEVVMDVVARTSNRLFVGLPLCRNADYCELNKQFTIDVFTGAAIINLFPSVLKPIARRLLTKVPQRIARGMKHLQPMIEERFHLIEAHGNDWPDKPNDLLQWLMDAAQGEERTMRALVLRVLTVNIAAIHTSSLCLQTFINALYLLAAYPQYIAPLRAEVEAVVESEGWTKAAMNKMRKVDSFLKESNRYTGLGAKSMTRLALKDFTFSDGTFIPAGTTISAPAHAVHFDEDIWPNADVFDPFRFSSLREEEGEGAKHQMVSTSLDYIPFGHGRHACPGRFFAANELKAMLAHVAVTYDVKMEKDGVLPPSMWFGTALVPNRKAQSRFREDTKSKVFPKLQSTPAVVHTSGQATSLSSLAMAAMVDLVVSLIQIHYLWTSRTGTDHLINTLLMYIVYDGIELGVVELDQKGH
ncbi:predicted protein [Postia placenta Mad-698-R]|nr:predicted protein [Postia placenta Mad-698-R]